jgi:hypothetical protein
MRVDHDSKSSPVEEQVDMNGLSMSHPQVSFGRASSMTFEEYANYMPQMMMTPPTVKPLCKISAAAGPIFEALAPAPDLQAPPVVPNADNIEECGLRTTYVSPSLASHARPANNTVGELTKQKVVHGLYNDIDQVPKSWVARLNRLEEAVIALLQDNIDLRQHLSQRSLVAAQPDPVYPAETVLAVAMAAGDNQSGHTLGNEH